MARDPWSVVDDSQPLIERLDLRARIDVAARVIEAEARLVLATPLAADQVIRLDARGLEVSGAGGLPFEREAPHPILGAPLRVQAPAGTASVTLTYRTTPDCLALDWRDGFVYSQCQPIYARALVPLHDTPSRRLRYTAEVIAPDGWTVLMAARQEGDRFVQDQPVPPYLFALAAARVEARAIGPRSQVWAAPAQLDRAARVFADIESWLTAAEALFGPAPLERFDLLVTPPSFPYGGMENPGLVFVHPSLLDDADDARRVVNHELTHAWVGNRVTAASAEHLWLNEGWAVWAERRLVGADAARAHEAVARRDLDAALRALPPARTSLKQSLTDVPPEEAGLIVPYEKGRLLLARLEAAVGRARFDAFARAWVSQPRTATTEDFCAFVDAELPGHGVDSKVWTTGPGLPADAPAAGAAPVEAAIDLGDAAAIARAEARVADSGRLQHVKPIWLALAQHPVTRPTVGALFRRLRDRWHPIARESIELLLRAHGIATREVNALGLGRRG